MTLSKYTGWAVAGVLGVVAATGVATADESSPATSGETASTSAVADRATARERFVARHPRLAAASKVMHGELVVETKDGTAQTVLVQRGTITAITEGELTVQSTDGYALTWTVDDDTLVRRRGDDSTLDALATGDKVWVRGPKADDRATAAMIRTAEQE